MFALLLLIPAAAYLLWRSPLGQVLRSLPNNNDDFVLF
ncbi:hypothetical protein SAMN05192549_103377 [Duganella sacchari]|uniref:Uncharacterized protein n=1 Tax=Duganella sacchari TaxID=551987 RepID=A0A1M7MXT1_9BURK|nr:hypothetical protein SAMN05192549_103377 [Duganella sacchari]